MMTPSKGVFEVTILIWTAHSASTLTVDFFANGSGYLGGTDVSFGLENVQVLVDATTAPPPVREPTTLLLLGLGLAGLGFARKRLH
jgi:hypothetical protein